MTTQLAGDLVVAVLDVWTKNVKGVEVGVPLCYHSLTLILRSHLHISNRRDPRNHRPLPLPRCVRSVDKSRTSFSVSGAWVIRA